MHISQYFMHFLLVFLPDKNQGYNQNKNNDCYLESILNIIHEQKRQPKLPICSTVSSGLTFQGLWARYHALLSQS